MAKEQYLDINGAELLWNRTKGQINELKSDLVNITDTERIEGWSEHYKYLVTDENNVNINSPITSSTPWRYVVVPCS